MKLKLLLVSALVTLAGFPTNRIHAQAVADDVGELLNASTICVASISTDAITSPRGLLTSDVFKPTLKMLGEFSRGRDVLVTFNMQQLDMVSSATMHAHQGDASLAEIDSVLEPYGLAPARATGKYFSVSLISSSRRGPAQERLPADASRLAELKAGFAAAEDSPVRIAILPPAHLWKVYRELLPNLPAALGGGQSSVLVDGLTWAGISLDTSSLSTKAVVQSADEKAAMAFAKTVPTWLRLDVKQIPRSQSGRELINSLSDDGSSPQPAQIRPVLDGLNEFEPIVRAILQNIKIETVGSQVHISMKPKVIDASGGDVAKRIFERALAPINERRKTNQLKKILLAMHNHESAYRYFPPGPKARGDDGLATLSWRVHILPFLGDEELALWKEFHLDEPWDSDHNKTLISKMPDVYAMPSSLIEDPAPNPGQTRFLAPHSDNTIMGQKEAISFRHVTDGTSNTIVVVEVNDEHAVPWTAPQDYDFDAEDPGKGLHVDADGRINCALMDGSAQRIEATVAPSVLNALFGMNDGQVVQIP